MLFPSVVADSPSALHDGHERSYPQSTTRRKELLSARRPGAAGLGIPVI
jgi:hypothetical protein